MKIIYSFVSILILISSCSTSKVTNEQNTTNQINNSQINNIQFDKDKIIIEKKLCYKYSLIENNFLITDLYNKELIKGIIKSEDDNNFSSIITFVTLNKKFHNKKIIGRNDIIFALCYDNVIDKTCKISQEKLKIFVDKNNELK